MTGDEEAVRQQQSQPSGCGRASSQDSYRGHKIFVGNVSIMNNQIHTQRTHCVLLSVGFIFETSVYDWSQPIKDG